MRKWLNELAVSHSVESTSPLLSILLFSEMMVSALSRKGESWSMIWVTKNSCQLNLLHGVHQENRLVVTRDKP